MKDEVTLTVMTPRKDGLTYAPVDHDLLISRKYPVPISEDGERRLILNPDVDAVIDITKKIRENKGLCPSKLSESSPDRLMQDTRCPCADLIIYGKCECGLFVETDLVPLIKKEEEDE